MVQSGLDQTCEQRVRLGRAGLELRMSLSGHIERVHLARKLDELGEFAVRTLAGNAQTRFTQTVLICHVHFVTVTMTFSDMRGAVQFRDDGTFFKLSRIGAKTHGVSHVTIAGDDVFLLLHGCDDWGRAIGLELGGVRVLQAEDVAGVFDDHGLQAEAQAEGRQLVLTGELQGTDLAVDATDAEASGNDDAVDLVERGGRALLGLALIGGDPLDVYLGIVGETTGLMASVTDR